MYSSYGNYGVSDPTSIITGIFAGLGILLVVVLVLAILSLVANYKVFKKMNIDGWKALIPGVNTYLQMEATGVDAKWLLIITYGGVISIIPLLGSLAYFIAVIYMAVLINVSLAKAFGKSTGFAVGLIFLYPIFLCILAFGDSKFIGANPMNDIIFGKKNNTNTNNNQPSQVTSGKTCPNCGAAVPSDSAFCTSCGTKVD